MNEEIMSRRTVLRGALAVGCGLVLPVSLLGCDSKPAANAPAAAPAAPTPAITDSAAAAAPAPAKKVAQASVLYQSQPKADQKCSGCMHFISGSNTCQLVEGQVSPEGWCALWMKKG